jgi:glycerate kinase
LAEGFHRGGAEAKELPIADGGEGTAEVLGARVLASVRVSDAFGRPREAPIRALPDGTAVVEAAEAIPLDPLHLDPLAASSRGLGELIAKVEAERLLVCLGGTANVDGGAGLREVLRELPARTTVLCDALVPLRDAALRFAPQKGATPEQVELLERRLAAMSELAPYAELPGAGAAGGLGAWSPARARSIRRPRPARRPARRCVSVSRRAPAASFSAAGSWSSSPARRRPRSAATRRGRRMIS